MGLAASMWLPLELKKKDKGKGKEAQGGKESGAAVHPQKLGKNQESREKKKVGMRGKEDVFNLFGLDQKSVGSENRGKGKARRTRKGRKLEQHVKRGYVV